MTKVEFVGPENLILDFRELPLFGNVVLAILASEAESDPVVPLATWLASEAATDPKSVLTLEWQPIVGELSLFGSTCPIVSRKRLPISLSELQSTISGCEGTPPDARTWDGLRDQAFRYLLEREASALRHDLKGIVAAVRIYFGALIAGKTWIDGEDQKHVKSVLDSFAKKATVLPTFTADEAAFIGRLRQYIRFSSGGLTEDESHTPLQVSALILDDNAEAHGWELLLEQLFTNSKAFLQWCPELEKLVAQNTWDSLLLDCNLDPEKRTQPSGLERLSTLRSIDPLLCITFMTACDDADLAFWSLRAGADHVFVKELTDRGDRRSYDYYCHFSELTGTRRSETADNIWTMMKSWRGRNGDQESQKKWSYLRLCFYFVMSYVSGTHWWRAGAGRVAGTDACEEVRAIVGTLLTAAFPKETPVGALTPLLNQCRHGNWPAFQSLMGAIEKFVKGCGNSSGRSLGARVNESIPFGCPLSRCDLNGGIESLLESERRDSHSLKQKEVSSIIGGLRLDPHMDGGKLLVIDDEGWTSGWFDQVLRLAPGACCKSEINGELRTPDYLKRFDAVLLDLRLPETARGLELLEDIKQVDPGLPIIVISGASESLPVIRAIKRGAVAFVPRRARSEATALEFVERLKETLDEALELGSCPERQSWRDWSNASIETEICPRILNTWLTLLNQVSDKLMDLPAPDQWAKIVKARGNTASMLAFGLHFRDLSIGKNATGTRWKYVQPPDLWRLEAFGTDIACLRSTTERWLVMPVIEEIARWRYCLREGKRPNADAWGKKAEIGQESVEIGPEVKWLSPEAHRWFGALRDDLHMPPLEKQTKVLLSSALRFGEFVART